MTARMKRKGTSIYKVRNWKNYNNSLRNRGDISLYISEDAIANWEIDPTTIKNKKRGRQRKFNDHAIEACLSLRIIFNFPLRQTEGFVNFIFKLMRVTKSIPDYTTLSRRTENLKINRKILQQEGPITLLIDSTGLKIGGSGEWEYEKHRSGRRKKWRKLHLAINEKTREIEASIMTGHLESDVSQCIPLIEQTTSAIDVVKADGGYDNHLLRKKLLLRGIKPVFSIPKHARLSKGHKQNPTPRDRDLLRIKKDGREVWEYASGYSKRNIVENAMFRYKQIIGSKLHSRSMKNQFKEIALAVNIINKMTGLGMPNSVRVR
jgi:IS5 family transposase